ncbi:MAG: response regulator transcription factor [Elusimicrobiales bacterium]|nr:response regulator transcription factor [Elusimicrobiales bacterium]
MVKINILFASKDFIKTSLLIEMIKRNGYNLITVTKYNDVLSILEDRNIDLLMISQELEDINGLVLLKNIRNSKYKDLPVIAVVESSTAIVENIPREISSDLFFSYGSTPKSRQESNLITYKLAFFQLGADECLFYDQDLHESLARIKAVVRRIIPKHSQEVIKVNEIELDMASYTVKVAGKEIKVTAKEFDLLYVFLSSPNRVLSRPYLLERIWGFNYFGSPRTVDVHIRRLRAKLGKAAKYIHTVSCVGYKFIP